MMKKTTEKKRADPRAATGISQLANQRSRASYRTARPVECRLFGDESCGVGRNKKRSVQ